MSSSLRSSRTRRPRRNPFARLSLFSFPSVSSTTSPNASNKTLPPIRRPFSSTHHNKNNDDNRNKRNDIHDVSRPARASYSFSHRAIQTEQQRQPQPKKQLQSQKQHHQIVQTDNHDDHHNDDDENENENENEEENDDDDDDDDDELDIELDFDMPSPRHLHDLHSGGIAAHKLVIRKLQQVAHQRKIEEKQLSNQRQQQQQQINSSSHSQSQSQSQSQTQTQTQTNSQANSHSNSNSKDRQLESDNYFNSTNTKRRKPQQVQDENNNLHQQKSFGRFPSITKRDLRAASLDDKTLRSQPTVPAHVETSISRRNSRSSHLLSFLPSRRVSKQSSRQHQQVDSTPESKLKFNVSKEKEENDFKTITATTTETTTTISSRNSDTLSLNESKRRKKRFSNLTKDLTKQVAEERVASASNKVDNDDIGIDIDQEDVNKIKVEEDTRLENNLLRERVEQLELTAVENQALLQQVKQLEWALDVVRDDAERVRMDAWNVIAEREREKERRAASAARASSHHHQAQNEINVFMEQPSEQQLQQVGVQEETAEEMKNEQSAVDHVNEIENISQQVEQQQPQQQEQEESRSSSSSHLNDVDVNVNVNVNVIVDNEKNSNNISKKSPKMPSPASVRDGAVQGQV